MKRNIFLVCLIILVTLFFLSGNYYAVNDPADTSPVEIQSPGLLNSMNNSNYLLYLQQENLFIKQCTNAQQNFTDLPVASLLPGLSGFRDLKFFARTINDGMAFFIAGEEYNENIYSLAPDGKGSLALAYNIPLTSPAVPGTIKEYYLQYHSAGSYALYYVKGNTLACTYIAPGEADFEYTTLSAGYPVANVRFMNRVEDPSLFITGTYEITKNGKQVLCYFEMDKAKLLVNQTIIGGLDAGTEYQFYAASGTVYCVYMQNNTLCGIKIAGTSVTALPGALIPELPVAPARFKLQGLGESLYLLVSGKEPGGALYFYDLAAADLTLLSDSLEGSFYVMPSGINLFVVAFKDYNGLWLKSFYKKLNTWIDKETDINTSGNLAQATLFTLDYSVPVLALVAADNGIAHLTAWKYSFTTGSFTCSVDLPVADSAVLLEQVSSTMLKATGQDQNYWINLRQNSYLNTTALQPLFVQSHPKEKPFLLSSSDNNLSLLTLQAE